MYCLFPVVKRGGGALHSLVSLHRVHSPLSATIPDDEWSSRSGPFVMSQVRREEEIGPEARRGKII